MKINLPSFIETYFFTKNPATSKRWTQAEIEAAMGTPGLLSELFAIIKTENDRVLDEEFRVATKDEILVAIEAAHPGAEPLVTPFGLVWQLQPQGSDRKLGDLSVTEALAMFPGLSK
jgi:hypothetical protein